MNVLPSDMPQRKLERVAVYFDYENVHRTGHGLYTNYGELRKHTAVHPMMLAKRIVAKRNRPSRIEAVEVFRGRPVPAHEPAATGRFDKLRNEWTGAGCIVTSRDLKYVETPDGPYPHSIQEKGIDVALAVKMAQDATTGRYDAQVLFSSDNDLLPVVELVNGLESAHIEVACWSGARPLSTTRGWPYCHYLTESDFIECRSSSTLDFE